MTVLVALAGPSRSGKGTCASVFAQQAQEHGFTSFERQLSDNGKWHLARIFRPTIGRAEAVAWFEGLKFGGGVQIRMIDRHRGETTSELGVVPLQKFLQHGMQDGGRDIFGADLWTNMIIPHQVLDAGEMTEFSSRWPTGNFVLDNTPMNPAWLDGFFDVEASVAPTDLAIISDLRQQNEAERVKDIDGVVVQCIRPTVADPYRTGSDHITERQLDDNVDYQIINDDGVDELIDQAVHVFVDYILPRLQYKAGRA